MTALLRSELRKTLSTRLWWGLGVPVALLSALVTLFGGVLGDEIAPPADGDAGVLLASLAYALALTAVFATVAGIVTAAGEFRHRTITTTYLAAPARGRVLAAKMAVSALVGGSYAASAAVVGVLVGWVVPAGGGDRAGSAFPDARSLFAVVGIGVVVAALWAATGAALGVAVANQVGALVPALLYLLIGELLISTVLNSADDAAVAGLTAYLPGNAGDVALYDIPARVLGGPAATEIVETLAGVTDPLGRWGSLLVLAAWTVGTGVAALVVGGRRDVT